MVAFASDISGKRRIEAHPLDASGNPLLAAPVALAAGAWLSGPTVAWNGALYLVTWSNDSSNVVYAKRVLENGSVLDATPITVMPGNTPDVAALGSDFLVAASHAPTNPEFRNIYSRRVRGSDGALLDPSPVQIGGSFSLRPRVAAFADRWIVTWSGFFSHDDVHANIQLAFVGADGTPGATATLVGPTLFNYMPEVSAFGDTGLVAWHDPRVSNADWNVYARRVLRDGTVLDAPGFALTTAQDDQFGAALAWNGTEFVAAFEDRRARTFFLDNRADVFGTRIDRAGTVLDPSGFAAFADSLPEGQPALAQATLGVARIAASVFMDQAPYAAYRIALRLTDAGVAVGAEPFDGHALALVATPNPSPRATAIALALPVAGQARIDLYDVRGRLVRPLLDKYMPAGRAEIRWDGNDAAGHPAAPGVYLLRLESAGATREIRIVKL